VEDGSSPLQQAEDERAAATPPFPITLLDVALMVAVGVPVLALICAAYVLTAKVLFGRPSADIFGSQDFTLFAATVQVAVMVGAVRFFGLQRRAMSWRDAGLSPVASKWIWRAVLLAVVCIPLIMMVTVGFQKLLGRPVGSPQARFIAPEGFSWTGAGGMLLLGGLAAPFAEELFFRGVLFRLLRRYWGVAAGVIVSSLLFGLSHVFVEVMPGTVLLGIVMALLYQRSGSLWVPMTFHAVYNSASLGIFFWLLAAGVEV